VKQILLILAVVALVGCGGSKEKEEKSAKAKAAAEAKEESAKVIEATIRLRAKKPTGELTKADLEKITRFYLENNQLTDVKGLEKLTQLKMLRLQGNPDLTKAQITELQKALPKCTILSNPTK
jgi:Leucine-rich repeat (LRR) protein